MARMPRKPFGVVGFAVRALLSALAPCIAGCLVPALPNPPGPRTEPRSAASASSVAPAAEAPGEHPKGWEAEPHARTDGRLPALATPAHYDLELFVDPRATRFSGKTRIDLRLTQATNFLVLHARNLDVTSVTAEIGGDVVPGRARQRHPRGAAPDELVIHFSTPLAVGHVVLRIDYGGPFEREGSAHGLFRVKEPSGWFAFTQFEAVAARQMFPCFDEPGFKVPFDLSVTVPVGMAAYSNMPDVGRTPTEEGIRFRFATTPPLPTYLVAIAVGDFDVTAGSTAPVPIRLIRPRGSTGTVRPVLDAAEHITKELAEELAQPYPFPSSISSRCRHLSAAAWRTRGS